jgi:APA family basic amino acid/polyamine antiporter
VSTQTPARIDVAIAQANADRKRLDGTAIGLLGLVLLGVSSVVGSGIFVTSGTAAAKYAGPAVVISFLLAGLVALLTAVAYAEMAAILPVPGSTYSYAFATFGPFIAWAAGWTLLLEYLFSAGTVAAGWAGYANDLLADIGLPLPQALSAAPLDADPGIINLPAFALSIVMGLAVYAGTRESARLNGVMVGIKVAVLLLVIGIGAFYVSSSDWTPFIPTNEGVFGEYGWSGIIRAAGIVFFAYIGFDAISTAAGETRNAQRIVPLGLIIIVLFTSALYVAVSLVITGLVPYKDLNVPDPIAVAFASIGGFSFVLRLLDVGALVGLAATVLVTIYGQSRIFLRMGEDGMLPARFGKISVTRKTPGFATMVSAIGVAIVAGVLPLDILVELVSVGTLLAFVLVAVAVLYLRVTRPDLERPFRVPLVWVVCPAAILGSALLVLLLPYQTWIRFAVWLGIGVIIYFAYARSRVRRKESERDEEYSATGHVDAD